MGNGSQVSHAKRGVTVEQGAQAGMNHVIDTGLELEISARIHV